MARPPAEPADDTVSPRGLPTQRLTPKPIFVDASGGRRRRLRILVAALVTPAVAYVALLVSTLLGGPTLPALLPQRAKSTGADKLTTSHVTEPLTNQHTTPTAKSASEPALSTKASTTKATTMASTKASTTKASTKQWSTRVIQGTYVLGPGESVASNRMRITMRTDGNLVITDENGVVHWSSHTLSEGAHAVFQGDGNFVVYNASQETLWSSNTAENPGAELVIQNDGNVVVLSTDGRALWAAGTEH
ncbi:hypothetical protein ABT255_43870 [Streptomyces mirabilis]|uniref:hypothetical protein n=1 Tax=Streptomyces mirabilis TaxID=68239 RepID=UPI003321BEA7